MQGHTMLIAMSLISGLVSASILFLLASGVSLIFGVCRVLNLAHGTFYMLAAYLAYSLSRLLAGSPFNFWLALIFGPLAIAALGAAVEVLVFRRIYRADLLIQLLPTIALMFIFADVVRLFWGLIPKSVSIPSQLLGTTAVVGARFPNYYFVVVLAGVLIATGLWYGIYRTRWGILVRAIAQDRDMSSALGVNEATIYTTVFALAVWLAGVAGVLSVPISGIALGADMNATIDAFVVVVVGGLGSIVGSMLSALLIGMLKSFGIVVLPQFAMAFVFALMVLVLIVRPAGLLGRRER
jgi:branched-chain amino acid transport system permease protein